MTADRDGKEDVQSAKRDDLFRLWNALWLTANEEAQAELFQRETLPPDFQATLQKMALRKTICAFAASLAAEGAGGGETIAKQAEVIRSMQAGRAAVVEECARLCDEKAIGLHHVVEKMTPKSSRVVDDTRLVGAAYSAAAAAIRSIVNLQESIKT